MLQPFKVSSFLSGRGVLPRPQGTRGRKEVSGPQHPKEGFIMGLILFLVGFSLVGFGIFVMGSKEM